MMRTDRLMGKMVGESVKAQVESSWFALGESYFLCGRKGGRQKRLREETRVENELFPSFHPVARVL